MADTTLTPLTGRLSLLQADANEILAETIRSGRAVNPDHTWEEMIEEEVSRFENQMFTADDYGYIDDEDGYWEPGFDEDQVIGFITRHRETLTEGVLPEDANLRNLMEDKLRAAVHDIAEQLAWADTAGYITLATVQNMTEQGVYAVSDDTWDSISTFAELAAMTTGDEDTVEDTLTDVTDTLASKVEKWVVTENKGQDWENTPWDKTDLGEIARHVNQEVATKDTYQAVRHLGYDRAHREQWDTNLPDELPQGWRTVTALQKDLNIDPVELEHALHVKPGEILDDVVLNQVDDIAMYLGLEGLREAGVYAVDEYMMDWSSIDLSAYDTPDHLGTTMLATITTEIQVDVEDTTNRTANEAFNNYLHSSTPDWAPWEEPNHVAMSRDAVQQATLKGLDRAMEDAWLPKLDGGLDLTAAPPEAQHLLTAQEPDRTLINAFQNRLAGGEMTAPKILESIKHLQDANTDRHRAVYQARRHAIDNLKAAWPDAPNLYYEVAMDAAQATVEAEYDMRAQIIAMLSDHLTVKTPKEQGAPSLDGKMSQIGEGKDAQGQDGHKTRTSNERDTSER